MFLGVIADDFTGAGDIAVALAKGVGDAGGLATVQFLGIPTNNAPVGTEAGVVALKSRSISSEDAVSQSLQAAEWLLSQGAEQIIFKYCSTFDSTKQGNIGPVAEALAARLESTQVIFCPSFPANGRTVYQGNLFVKDVPLSESSMAYHPLTPMKDSDIRRVLAAQCKTAVGHVSYPHVLSGSEKLTHAIEQCHAPFVVVDAITDGDLLTIARSQRGVRFVTGGSGIAPGLAHNFISDGRAQGQKPSVAGVTGPEIVLAGSCSSATLGQIKHHKAHHPAKLIDVDAVMAGTVSADDYVTFLLENTEKAPLLYSSADKAQLKRLQEQYGVEPVATRLDELFGEIASKAVSLGVRRIVVAGGETSGAVATALGHASLRVGPEIDPGVPVLSATDGSGVVLALKSGNFGTPDFFEKALHVMGETP